MWIKWTNFSSRCFFHVIFKILETVCVRIKFVEFLKNEIFPEKHHFLWPAVIFCQENKLPLERVQKHFSSSFYSKCPFANAFHLMQNPHDTMTSLSRNDVTRILMLLIDAITHEWWQLANTVTKKPNPSVIEKLLFSNLLFLLFFIYYSVFLESIQGASLAQNLITADTLLKELLIRFWNGCIH